MEGKIILVLFAAGLVSAVRADNSCVLYPFGTDEGDSEVDYVDDDYYDMTLSTSIPFMGEDYTSVNAQSNGVVGFGDGFYDYIIFGSASNYAYAAPFWLDHDFRDSPDISKLYFREMSSGDAGWRHVSRLATCDAARIGVDISPTVIVVVTWHKAQAFPSENYPLSPRNRFQAVVISDGTQTVIVFNYDELNFEYDYFNQYPAVQIDSGSGLLLEFPFSQTSHADTEVMKSNVDINGRIVFRVDQATPVLPSVTPGATCPHSCPCVVDRDSGDTTTYDGALLSGILMKAESKFIVSKQSQENAADQTDICKFALRTQTDEDGKMLWLGWNMGIHPNLDTKYMRNYMMQADPNDTSKCRIMHRGYKGTMDETTITNTVGITETFADANSGLDVKIEYMSGGGCELTSTACDYVLQYRPGDSVNQLSLKLGPAYNNKPIFGLCQNNNNDKDDDDKDCGYGNPNYTFNSPSTVAEIRDNCSCSATDKTCMKQHLGL